MRSDQELSIVDEELVLFLSLSAALVLFSGTERTSVRSVCNLTCLPRAVMRIWRFTAIEVLPAIHDLRLSRLSRQRQHCLQADVTSKPSRSLRDKRHRVRLQTLSRMCVEYVQ